GPLTSEQPRQVDPREDARGGRLGVSLHARELSGEEKSRVIWGREMRREGARRVDVRVAVDAAEPQELGALESRDHPEHALLLRDRETGLKADQVPHLPRAVFLPELHDGEGLVIPGLAPGVS